MEKKTLNIETVHQCNCCLRYKTLHPLVSVIDLSPASLEQRTVKCGFYTIILIEGEAGNYAYGRKYYDYSNASLIFRTPGESIKLDTDDLPVRKGRLLAFHPNLIACTALGGHIGDYSFFFYKPDESLHLSLREKMKVMECTDHIREELQHAIDYHSKTLISRYIELLLDYCTRFYERQFITRCEANQVILHRTDLLLDEYIRSGKLESGILPSLEYCADALHLSPSYFSDLLRFETGKSIREYFQLMRLEASKRMLLDKDNTVGMVARKLGYVNTPYFAALFKKLTGMTPAEYRHAQN